jgi:integrase
MASRAFTADVASVARMWVAAAYEDLRRAGPDRATQVRGILDRYVVPWFGPQTGAVGDITYFMVHDWLLTLVGRRPGGPDDGRPALAVPGYGATDRELSLRQVADAAEVSLATARRRWRDGELPGAYRDSHGHVRVPEVAAAELWRSRQDPIVGLSQSVVADLLWVLRRVLGFARANGIVPAGFDPTEGLEAPAPDVAAARARRPRSQPRPLSFPECARIAAHLHPVHQLALWLQRVMGLRISEAFGGLVDDVVDLGDSGLLLVRGQGGRRFRVRDDEGRIVTVAHTETLKTAAASRVLVVPSVMMELLRVALEAFHIDPELGDADETARLVPGLRADETSGQASFREAFAKAAAAEGLGSGDLGFRVSPHLLRKSVATDLAWQAGIEATARRRFMGHRAADDVFGRHYTLDHPELTPLAEVARVLDELIRGSIGTLVVPTTRRIRWGSSHRHFRAAEVDAALGEAGWMIDPDSSEDPLCDTRRVASELRVAPTTARRWMRDGTLRCVIVPDGDGIARRWARLSEVWALRRRLADRVFLPDLATELGVRYHELYRTSRRLGLEFGRHPTSRQFEVPLEAARLLRVEHARVRALHGRSMKLAAAARRLNLAVSTVGLMAKRGELDIDSESDSSGARFVTRASVEACRITRVVNSSEERFGRGAVALADVMRFTGRSRSEILDLVRAGVLEEVPGRGKCELTAESLRAWMTESA